MKHSHTTLYYVHDPMCSWCWGFLPVWKQVQAALPQTRPVRYVLGGLAPDTHEPMPESMQRTIKQTWQRIQQEIPGTQFNYDFWVNCQPRRSTYPACRAVLAAGMQSKVQAKKMLLAIQQAYYLQARNPSDDTVLIAISAEIGLDSSLFEQDFYSRQCKTLLTEELQLASALEAYSFPGLVLRRNESNTMISIDYTNSDSIVSEILKHI